MDKFKTFMDIFERAVVERDSTNLIEILKNSRQYFQNIAKDDSELLLSILFDKDIGLHCFINNELKRSTPQRGFNAAVKEAFHLLEFVMEQFSDIFDPYIIETKDTCQQAMVTQCSAFIQKAASSAFNKLIQLFNQYEIDLSETVTKFVSQFRMVDIKERSILFSVLGTIIKYNPGISEIQEYTHIIFKQLQNDFKKQYNPQTMSRSIDIFQVYLDVLSDILKELQSEITESDFIELYKWIKELSNPEKYSVKKVSMRAAINLLSRHIYRFTEFVYCDYEYWNILLTNLAQDKNVQCSECGQRALKSFYREIGNTLKHKASEDDKSIFLYFKNRFEELLKNSQEINSNILRFNVYGFSQMAAACKKYLTNEDVKNMFSLIATCAIPVCSRQDLNKAHLESICDYQEALSEIILHTSGLSIDQINIIMKLSSLIVKKFPDLPIISQNLAISSLISTVINVGIVDKNLLEEFLYNLVHEGVIWACSHTLLIDAELKRELDNLPERPTCYKNYLPLWIQMLKPNKYKEHTQVVQDVADSVILVGTTLINKLNLNTKTKEDNIFSDAAFSQIAENGADFAMFINIVDLYVDIIDELESSLLINSLHKFLSRLISMSCKHPFISGFYKLVRTSFKHICNLSKEDIEPETLEMLYKYLINVLNMIPTFSNELLTTCLYLVLNLPMMYVERILHSTIPSFKIAFTVGLSDFELACTAMNALEQWTNHLGNPRINAFLHEIVPFLDPYLQSGESSIEILQDIIKTERKVIKRIILRDDENTLERFQMRVLLFISSLDTDIIMSFIYKRSMDVGASWDKKDLLKYSLTFTDIEVNIHFDKILPRLLSLAQNSGDRRIKLLACEALYSIIGFVLGVTSQHLTSNPDQFVPVYVQLCPALLYLGCDHDEAARQIFQPLMLQLTHWLSSKFMLISPTTIYFLDSLFEGLCSDSNSSLREFSGMCLAEFTKWSIKQSDNDKRTQSNIHEVICRITNFACHPSSSKRIAAATAFNHLYTILREDEKVVSIYWFEILYSFVKGLDGCNDPSIIAALDHVERVLIVKQNLLNAVHNNRRKPQEFEGTVLTDAVNWLLTQCGCLDQCCRAKSMELVTNISKHVAHCKSPEMLINNYIQNHGIEGLNFIILNNLKPKMESLSIDTLLPLLRSLHCYIWLIGNKLVSEQCLFGTSNLQKETIFNCTRNFIHVINRIKVEDKEDVLVMLSKELEDLQTLQCKVLVTVLDFVQILMNLNEHLIPNFFFNKDLFELIAKCIMSPEVLGFDSKNLEITNTLFSSVENVLQTIVDKNNSSLLYLIKSEMSIHVERHIKGFIDLNKIVFNTGCSNKFKPYVRGLCFLKRHNILQELQNVYELNEHLEEKVTCVFNILAKECMGELIRVNIKPSTKDYLRILMKFFLLHYEPCMTTKLIELIENDTMLGPDAKKIEHGTHFLNTFKSEIFKYMLKDIEKIMQILTAGLQRNPSRFLFVIEQLFLFVQRYKKKWQHSTEVLANTVIKNFTGFESAVNNLEDRKEKLISIFRIAIYLKYKPIEVSTMSKDFYSWILNQLTENSDMEYKIRILQNFLVGLTDMTTGANPELLAILRSLRNNRLDVSPTDFKQANVKALKVINCFQTLASLLPVTKSVVLFESIILFTAGIADELYNEKANEYIQKYFALITTDYAFQSLQSAYKLFMNLNTPVNERFSVLKSFLLPSFEYCRSPEIYLFFEKNIKEIHMVVQQSCNNLDCSGNSSDIKQLIVSKIGCYDLVAKMFAKINISQINDTESAITRNAIDNVITGKELVQSLYSNALNVRTLKGLELEDREIMRLLQCSAYNCSIAIVSSLKKDEDSYVSIFAENRKKNQLIWENIVDCQRQYNFQQTVKEYPKYTKKLVNIRKSMKHKQVSSHYTYIYSYNLSTCTLNEDINAYDFNDTTVKNKLDVTGKEENMSLTFENDDLNNHECMPYICAVLKHMISEEISVLPTDDNITMPKWLKCFFSSIISTSYDNVKLFMLKVVLNMQTVFKPYSEFFLRPIIHTIYSYLKRNQLNYIIIDAIEMLIDWQISRPQTSTESTHNEYKVAVQHLWETIIQKVIITKNKEISRSVYKYNMNMVKTILEVWRNYLKLPENLSDKIQSAPGPAVYLVLICFVNGMEKDIIEREDIIEFLEKSLENWRDDEETLLQCCECIGLVLKFLEHDEALTNKKCAIIDKIRSVLRQMQTTFENRQMKCIHALSKNYPTAAIIYFEFVTANMFRVDPEGKSNCLEIFLLCIPNLSKDQILKELAFMKFTDLLRNKISTCEKIALKIINTLITVLPSSNILSLVALVPPYTKHDYSEYRESAYNIFINIYKKYITNTSEEEEVKKLLHISREILLNAVLDPSETLQEMILNFWTQDAQLTNTCKERLLEILDTYTPSVGQKFLSFALLLILDLTKKSRNYAQKLFKPLHECSYADYKIALLWRTKNLGSKAPLFAPSLISQMNQTFTQISSTLPSSSSDLSYSRSFYDSNYELDLKATQEPEFLPTFVADHSITVFSNAEQDETFKVPNIPDPAYNKKSKRFLSSASDLSDSIRQKQIKKNVWRAEMIKEESARQRSTIKVYRKYRIGDFPDIEMSHAALIEPLQRLAKTDPLICKDLTVSIICSLLADGEHDSFVKRLADKMKHIIENEQDSNSTVATILEILLNTRITNCSPEAIARISKSNSLNFLGSLVLEENLIYETNLPSPPRKKIKPEIASELSSEWLQLTYLYESMNDIDVVLSIFQNHITNEDIQIASLAQASNNWVKAKVAYEKAYEIESNIIKEHSLQGLFECLGNLCCWDQVERCIKTKLEGQLDTIWNDPWKDWMFPWLFEVQIRKLVDSNFNDEFDKDVHTMQSWLNDEVRLKYIKRFFGDESSMFFLHNQVEVAREFLLNTLDEMREQWISLHPLSTLLRIRKLERLRLINDVDRVIKILKSAASPSDPQDIIKFWSYSLPSVQDNILPWDKLTSYRIYFIDSFLTDKLEQHCSTETDSQNDYSEEENNVKHKLDMITFNMRLKMIEAALSQSNKYISKKYLLQMERKAGDYSIDMKHQFRLTGAKIKYLSGEMEEDLNKKLSSYTSSWKHCQNILNENAEDSTSVDVRKQISKIASKLVQLSEENETFSELLRGSSIILQDIKAENNDFATIRDALQTYNFNNLKTCCDVTTTDIRECYFTLAKHCYDRLSRGAVDVEVSKEFVHSILKAMSYGSLNAAHYFPCLLKPEYLDDQETKEIFMKESEGVQTWLFLSWQAQLFSNLGTPIAPLIIPILKRIADTYPNAVVYSMRLTVETNPALLNETSTYEIRKILYNRTDIDRFLLALQYVVQPELYLQHYLTEFVKNLALGPVTAVDILMKKVYPNARENREGPKLGSIFSEIAKYKNKIKELENKKLDEIRLRIVKIMENIKESLHKRKNKYKLQDYSPWLSNFTERDIEIPGQYTGNRKPMPQYHARILKFERTVKVMESMRKPIRITMIGNDAKEYHFLVKFGEDLRQDQRLQQLFSIMNKTLHIDPACRQRQLSIDTYQVVPLSKTVGLIQWVNNTRSLQELINFTLSKQEITQYDSILRQYNEWVRNAAPSKRQHEWYKEAVLKYSSSTVITKMNEFIGKTKWDSLRKTLKVLCPSVETFVTMRRNFIISYATMCIAHWILGIGDRHLQNTLIVINSGRCLGIDFGLAFDAGVDQRVPELMPFRLTPQILGLLKPFTENDLLGAIMIHVLRALRKEKGPILSCMDVFVHEPLNWTEHINKGLRENENEDSADIKWIPIKKITAVKRKLNGIKPSLVTLDQLKEQHNDKYFDRYYAIVSGNDDIKRVRVRMKDNLLTPEEQVECLLDQATDMNILGRTFVGWKPWL